MRIPKPLLSKVNSSASFLAHIHLSPDADTIGSALALRLALESEGKVMEVFCEDEIPEFATFLPGIESVKQMPLSEALATFPHDYYLALDTPIFGLLTRSTPVPVFPQPILVVDHHLDPAILGQVTWSEIDASSTAEMIFHLIQKLNIGISKDIATCLLFGILGDTGCFQNFNTNAKIFTIVSELIKKGGDYQLCLVQLQRSIPFYEFQSWGILLDHLELSEEQDFVYLAIDQQTWEQVNPATKIALFANQFLGQIADTKFGAILVEKKPGIVGGTLRARLPQTDVQQIAQRLSGGGHKASAGFRFQGTLQEAKREFLNTVNLLKSQGKL